MTRRYVCLALIWTLTAVTGNVTGADAPRSDTIKQELPDGGRSNIELQADALTTWTEASERIVALSGKLLIKQGATQIRAERAIVWVAVDPQNDSPVTKGTIYALGNVRISIGGKTQEIEAALLTFSTRGKLDCRGPKIENKSVAHLELYQKALQARRPALERSNVPPQKIQDDASVRSSSSSLNASPYNSIQPVQATTPPATAAPPPRLDPVPGSKGGPVTIEPPSFETPALPVPNLNTRKLKIANRSSNPTNVKFINLPSGEQVAVITGGIKLLAIIQERGQTIVDMEADQLIVWQKGDKDRGTQQLVEAMQANEGASHGKDRETEVYLSGNVVMRYGSSGDKRNPDGSPVEDKIMRADRVYYDLTKNKAIALDADLEITRTGVKEPAHFRADEMRQLSAEEYVGLHSNANAGKLPGDPGLNLRTKELIMREEKEQVRRTIFGFPVVDRFTGAESTGTYHDFKSYNTYVEVGGIPIMYFPYFAGDLESPFGPLQALNYRQDRIFGAEFLTTWSILEMLGIKKLPGERWNLELDYLDKRGVGLGMTYDLAANRLFGFDAPFITHVQAYAINDNGHDILGGPRENDYVPTEWRGRFQLRHIQEYENWSFQGQVSYLSDRNFLEQYYKYEHDYGPNQETFTYLKYQDGNGAASILAEPNLNRPWVTETQWLPKAQAYWLGQSFFDRLTYNTWMSAGYANLKTFNLPAAELPPGGPSIGLPFETPINTGRFDWMQQISMPINAGALQIVPYGNVDLTYYTQDYAGDNKGRFYGGGGARATLPLSRLYTDADSELFNVHGIFHKITVNGNYYAAWADTPSSVLPQLDRLNDDATQQSLRDIKPWLPVYLPGGAGDLLSSSPLYDPRLYALRRLVDTSVESLDTVQVVEASIRQRWQTKRGYPGMEHTVDYVTLDLSASFFPAKNRDNFGHPISFVEYDATWAVGDRTGLTSSGWLDPYDGGTRYWNVNAYSNRPDGTSYTLGYRQFDPVGSRVVSGSLAYIFSPKYSVTFSGAYDLSITQNASVGLNITRTGTDLTWNVGFTYNAILKNLSFNFMVLPNLMVARSGGILNAANSVNGLGAGQGGLGGVGR